jgi:hypothetical protein
LAWYAFIAESKRRKSWIHGAYWPKLSDNFSGHPSGVNKLAYFYTPGFAGLFYFNARGNGAGALAPEIDVQNAVSHGFANFWPNLVPSARIPRNQWYKIEIVAVGNTAGKAGGSVDWYLDGVHVGSQTLQWETGASTWGYFHYCNGWGGIGGTVPATMTLDWDHVYLSGKN